MTHTKLEQARVSIRFSNFLQEAEAVIRKIKKVSIDPVTMVLIDLSGDIIPAGAAHILVRFDQECRDIVRIAAQALGMQQAEFARTALVRAAQKVIAENARR